MFGPGRSSIKAAAMPKFFNDIPGLGVIPPQSPPAKTSTLESLTKKPPVDSPSRKRSRPEEENVEPANKVAKREELSQIEEELAAKKEMLSSANALIDESMRQLEEMEKTEAALIERIGELERKSASFEVTKAEFEAFRTKIADSLNLVKKDSF